MFDFKLTRDYKLSTIVFTDTDNPTSLSGQHAVTVSDDRFYLQFNHYVQETGTVRHFWDLYIKAGARFDHEAEPQIVLTINIDSHPDLPASDSHATTSTQNAASHKQELTFTGIDEHDLTALLEGLIYTPDENYNGNDILEISVSDGTTTKAQNIAVRVNAVDDAGRIVNFGDQVIHNNLAGDVIFRIDSDFIPPLDSFDDFSPHRIEKAAPTKLDFGGDAFISDSDGYSVAGGKLRVRIVEQIYQGKEADALNIGLPTVLDSGTGEISRKNLITARFEDGASQQNTEQEGVFVNHDRGATSVSFTTPLTLASQFTGSKTPFNDQSGSLTVLADNFVDALIDSDLDWTRAETSAVETTNDPIILKYYLPTTQAEVNQFSTAFGLGSSTTVSSALSEARLTAINKAIAAFEAIANIDFQKVTSYSPDTVELVFIQSGFLGVVGGVSGRANLTYTRNGEDLTSPVSIVSLDAGRTDAARNSSLFASALHELAHAIGLRHPGFQQGNEGLPYVESQDAIFANSIMAYVTKAGLGAHFNPTQPQIFDILALQQLYGANPAGTNAGDTVYDFTTIVALSGYHTIYDTAGIDTLNFNLLNATKSIKLDMLAGERSDIPSSADFTIAFDTIIENAIGTRNDDIIRGNDADNILEGGAGADILDGRGGSDTASYASSLVGVTVDLSLAGGVQLSVADTTPSPVAPPLALPLTLTLNLDFTPPPPVNYAQRPSTFDHSSGDTLISIENLIGSAHADTLIGNRDHNRLEGGGGHDTLTGGGGKDTFVVELGIGKGHDTITDWQRSVDTLVLQMDTTLQNFLAAFTNGLIKVRKPDDHTFELFLTAAPTTDYVRIEFIDTIADITSFRDALGGDDYIQTEIV